MILVRDIFRIKFGQTKQATALWKQASGMLKESGYGVNSVRLLTDLVGPDYYTLILETTYNSLADWDKAHQSARGNQPWTDVYKQIQALTETGRREILSIIE
jgi:hypothetical protein